MNLFNYLMAKKGHNTSVRDDLFSYLLGKRTPKEVKTATGTTISISDVTSEKIVSLTLSKESSQDGTPTPENPVEVKTVKGNVGITITDGTNTRNYTIPLGNNEICGIGDYKDELIVDKNGKCWLNKKTSKVVLDGSESWANRPNYTYADRFVLSMPTGYYKVSHIGYSNYFVVKEANINNDYPYLDTNSGQTVINFSTKGTTTLEQFKTWLSTHNTQIYYVSSITGELIDLNYTVDLTLFKGVNNISNSDDMNMTLEYY